MGVGWPKGSWDVEDAGGLPPAVRTALAPMVAALLSLGSEVGKLDKAGPCCPPA